MTQIVERTGGRAQDRVPSHDDLVARAAVLRDPLWRDAPECDRRRRLTEADVDGLTAAGLFRLMTPRRYGGYATDMRTLLDVAIEVGRGCCSAAWVLGVCNAGNFVVSLFPRDAQDEVWATNPDARTALVLGRPAAPAEPLDDGYRVSGEWAYASGSPHADWVCVLALADTGTGMAPHFVLMPAGQVRIKDTWHFAGMRGTGSNTIVAERVTVPRHRLMPYQPLLYGQTDGLVDPAHPYRNSLTGLFMIGLLGSVIGGVDAAFDYVREQAAHRPVAGSTFANQAESPMFRLDLAEAASCLQAARAEAFRLAATADELAAAGRNADWETRARGRMGSTWVTRQCRAAIETLMTAHGTSAFSHANPMQRIWRDVHVASRHAGFGMGVPELVYGHALLGRDPREISPLV